MYKPPVNENDTDIRHCDDAGGIGSTDIRNCVTFVEDALAINWAGGHIVAFGTTRVVVLDGVVENVEQTPASESQVPVNADAVGNTQPGVTVYTQPGHDLSV